MAFIMDGNGRWGRRHGLSRSEGHRAGLKAARTVVEECNRVGIAHVTLYTFSRENWNRPQSEITFLFDLLRRFLNQEISSLMEQDIRLGIFGDLQDLPAVTRQAVKTARDKTGSNQGMQLNLALNYSGRDEIVRACRAILKKAFTPEQINEKILGDHLYTAGQPDPDLIIRTAGEKRLSNYLLYQAAYAELYFTTVLWPDFDAQELNRALSDYAGRKRRFGGV